MKLHGLSVPIKLLILILPLICIPISIVGYWSFQTSVESVTRLSREHQLLQASEAARQIGSIFQSCNNDLGIMTQLIASYLKNPNVKELIFLEDEFIRKTNMLMETYIKNTPYYLQIRFVDEIGRTLLAAYRKDHVLTDNDWTTIKFEFMDTNSLNISPIIEDSDHKYYSIYLAKSVLDKSNHFYGRVIIDFDYTKVIDMIKNIHIGSQGHAFLVDKKGRIIAHPIHSPYEYDLMTYEDSRLREFIVRMLSGETGWMTFHESGEKAAAFAPIPTMDWSLAVTIPIKEFTHEAMSLQSKAIQIVLVMIFISTIIVIFLSFRIIRPMRNLVLATEQVASGDLTQEIPIRSHDELGLLTESFNRMIRSLREIQNELVTSEKLIAMGRLSAGVAHEIRNPLNAMKGAIAFLQRRKSKDPTVMEYTGIILEEVDRLSQFVTEFLLFAKQSTPQKTPQNINDLIRNTLALFNNEFRTYGIKALQHLQNNMPMIMVDPQQLEQVFLNIFINAVHAMPKGGRIFISSQFRPVGSDKTPSTIMVSIMDNGTGIEKENLKYIFDPFYSTKESGTGLGLPISLGIVNNHGGTLRVFSTMGKGTTFNIELPVD